MASVEPANVAAPASEPSPFDAGVRALLDAELLANSEDGLTSALLLGRAALRHLLRATLLERGKIELTTPEADLWPLARLLPVPEDGAFKKRQLSDAEDWFERFVVSPTGDLALAEVPKSERAALLGYMLTLALGLAGPLDKAKNGAVRRARRRWRRGLFVVVVLALAVGFLVRCAGAPRNLALGRPVVAVDAGFGVNPAGLVDGDQLTVGFHSSARRDPNVTIDLGSVQPVSRIEIFNRPDCCQERAVPLLVQTSLDGRTYSTVRREPHTFFHLTVRLEAPTSARYVRLLRGGIGVFHLSEVEVF